MRLSKERMLDLKRRISIIDVAKNYNLNVTGGPYRYAAHCPFHGDDATPSLIFYTANEDDVDSFSAFCCTLAGDPLEFILRYEQMVLGNTETNFHDVLTISEKYTGIKIGDLESNPEITEEFLRSKITESMSDNSISPERYAFTLNIFYRDILFKHKGAPFYSELLLYCDQQFDALDHFLDTKPSLTETQIFCRTNIEAGQLLINQLTTQRNKVEST